MLETIWFVLWAVLWAVYFILDGFDLGAGCLLPVLSKDDKDRRYIYNATGPFWDGNEVWLITAGGVTFAAFPGNYAVMFSALYTPLLMILFALIVRGVAFEFRRHIDDPRWKKLWDICMFAGSFVAAFLFGVAFAGIFAGIPIDEAGHFQGSIINLLTPYNILGGALFVMLFMLHGSIWLAIKTNGELKNRASNFAKKIWPFVTLSGLVFIISTGFATNVFNYYMSYPVLFVIPLMLLFGFMLIWFFIEIASWWKAWFASGLVIGLTTFFGLAGIFPRLLPSSINDQYSMTIFNSASSPLTLKIMLVVVIVFIPIVIGYQTWVYYLFKDKVTEKDLIY
jgi:cytochrome d ubiquinol oxidase subunit II